MGLTLLFIGASVVGLLVGAYGCLAVIILFAPETGSEASLWFILPSAAAGAVALPMLVRRFRRR